MSENDSLVNDPLLARCLATGPAETRSQEISVMRNIEKEYGIRGFCGLLKSLSSIRGEDLDIVLRVIARCRSDRVCRALTDLLVARPDEGAGICRSLLAFRTTRAVQRLSQMLSSETQPDEVRYWSAASLGNTRTTKAIAPLCAALNNQYLASTVRAQSAESLGVIGASLDRRVRLSRMVETALLAGLESESVDIRFWCAFALRDAGTMRSLPQLRRHYSDMTVCPGWWSIAKESKAAARAISRRRAR